MPAGPAVVSEDVDFDSVGAVRTRDGLQSGFNYPDFSISEHATSGANIAYFGESPWTNPNNISIYTPGTYATTNVGGVSAAVFAGTPTLDSFVTASSSGGTLTTPTITPTQVSEFALFFENPQESAIYTPTGGPGPWTAVPYLGSLAWWQELPNTTPFPVTATWNPNPPSGVNSAILSLFKTNPGTSPAIVNTPVYLNWGAPNHNAVTTSLGSVLLVACFTSSATQLPAADIVITDSQSNVYAPIMTSYNNPQQVTVFAASGIPGGAMTINIQQVGGPVVSQQLAYTIELAGINSGGTGLDRALPISVAFPTSGPITTTLSLTPSNHPEFAIIVGNNEWGGTFSVDGSWTGSFYPGGPNFFNWKTVSSGACTATITGLANLEGASYVMALFSLGGGTPAVANAGQSNSVVFPGTVYETFSGPVQTGNSIFVYLGCNTGAFPPLTPTTVSVTDNFGNTYVNCGMTSMTDYINRSSFATLWVCTNAIGGAGLTVAVTANGSPSNAQSPSSASATSAQ